MKKIIPIFLFFMLLMTIIPIESVSATEIEVFHFENSDVVNDYEGVMDLGYIYHQGGSVGDITADYPWDGNTRTFKLRSNRYDSSYSQYWLNFSYDYSLINKISLWFYINDNGQTQAIRLPYITFYNTSGDLTLNEVLKVRFAKETDVIDIQNADDDWIELCDLTFVGVTGEFDGYYCLNITHIANNTMNYSIYDEDYNLLGSVINTSRNLSDWSDISHIYFNGRQGTLAGTTADWMDFYFDTIEIDYSGEANETGLYDVCPQGTIGSLGYGSNHIASANNYLLYHYHVEGRYRITRLDLAITQTMASGGYISAKILNNNLGTADSYNHLSTDGSYLYATWDNLEIDVENEYLYIIFKSPFTVLDWAVPSTTFDINGDGFIKTFSTNNDNFYNNFENYFPNGTSPSIATIQGAMGDYNTYNEELYIRMCANIIPSDIIPPNDDYPDFDNSWIDASLEPNGYQIRARYFFNYSNYIETQKGCFIDTPSSSGYRDLNNSIQQSYFIYSASETGIFWFNLSAGGINVSSDSVTITSIPDDRVWVVPTPSLPCTTFYVFYNYSHASVGRIVIYDLCDNNKLLTAYTYDIETEGSGSYPVSGFCTDKCLRLQIQKYVTGSYYDIPTANTVHSVVSPRSNHIEAIGSDFEVGKQLILEYSHSMLCDNVYIRFGNDIISSGVGCSSSGTVKYVPRYSGITRIELVLNYGTGTRVLAYDIINIYGEGGTKPSSDTELFPELDPFLAQLLGFVVVIFGAMMPILIQLGLQNITHIDVNPFISLLTGATAMVFVVAIGWWSFWALFFVLAIGLMGLAFLYFTKTSGG